MQLHIVLKSGMPFDDQLEEGNTVPFQPEDGSKIDCTIGEISRHGGCISIVGAHPKTGNRIEVSLEKERGTVVTY